MYLTFFSLSICSFFNLKLLQDLRSIELISFSVWLNNLFDKNGYLSRYDDFASVGSESVGGSGYPGFGIRRTGSKPRVVGIRFRYRY